MIMKTLATTPLAETWLLQYLEEVSSCPYLEAPRHLAISDAPWLMGWLPSEGLEYSQTSSSVVVMNIKSKRIKRRYLEVIPADVKSAKKKLTAKETPSLLAEDIVQIVCTRNASRVLSPVPGKLDDETR